MGLGEKMLNCLSKRLSWNKYTIVRRGETQIDIPNIHALAYTKGEKKSM